MVSTVDGGGHGSWSLSGLNENVSPKFKHLNTWSPAGGTVWEGLGGWP